MVKKPAYSTGYPGLIPGSVRSLGKGNGYTFQYSCLENSKNRGAWWATVHGVEESDTTEWLTLSRFIPLKFHVDQLLKHEKVPQILTVALESIEYILIITSSEDYC